MQPLPTRAAGLLLYRQVYGCSEVVAFNRLQEMEESEYKALMTLAGPVCLAGLPLPLVRAAAVIKARNLLFFDFLDVFIKRCHDACRTGSLPATLALLVHSRGGAATPCNL